MHAPEALPKRRLFPALAPHVAVVQESPGSHEPAHRPALTADHGLVTTGGNPIASMAGLRILLAAGNAPNAAMATLATLQVIEPMMSGAAGNEFFTICDRATDRVYSLRGTGAAALALDAFEVTADELARGLKAGADPAAYGLRRRVVTRRGTANRQPHTRRATGPGFGSRLLSRRRGVHPGCRRV